MNIRRLSMSFVLFACAAGFSMSNLPVQAADEETKAKITDKKKAQKKKFLESLKNEDKSSTQPASPESKPTVVAPAANAMSSQQLARFIDMQINQQLSAARIPTSGRSTDEEFIRRAYLDITGAIPPADRVLSFLQSSATDKRAKLIEELLASPQYGQRLADQWMGMMYPIDSDNRFVNKQPLAKWLKETFNANLPWNQMAYEILTATGEQEKVPAVTYYMANRGVDKMTDSTAKLFLGIQLQCAQCHNHPFTDWKQTEYWGMAQFFYKVNVTVDRPNAKVDTKNAVSEEGRINRKMNPLPESAKSVSPKFLGGEEVKLASTAPARPVLAKWMTAPDNPFFAKAMVNRIWNQFFGRGLVNPVDDMLEENRPTHPELLDTLAKEFVASGFDIKHLIRSICNSEAYQRTSRPTQDNKNDTTLYSHMAIKALTPEQLFDSIVTTLGVNIADVGSGKGKGGVAPKGTILNERDRFALFFQPSDGAKPTEYDAGIPQALRLMNANRYSSSPNLIKELAKDSPDTAIDKLFVRVLSRHPSTVETTKFKDYIAKQTSPATAYSDLLWVLINTSEFALNR